MNAMDILSLVVQAFIAILRYFFFLIYGTVPVHRRIFLRVCAIRTIFPFKVTLREALERVRAKRSYLKSTLLIYQRTISMYGYD